MPGGGFSTAKIELPAAWNKLTEALGYQPLDNYMLEPSTTTAVKSVKKKNTSYQNSNSRMYNMRGQQIGKRPSRGVYIQSGRKMLYP